MMIAFSLLKDGIDNVSLSLNSIHYEKAKINAMICLEDTLIRIKREHQFNVDLNYIFNEDADEFCQTDITWSAPVPAGLGITEAHVELFLSGHGKGFNRNFEYRLLVRQHPVNHTDGSLTHTNNINILSINELTD